MTFWKTLTQQGLVCAIAGLTVLALPTFAQNSTMYLGQVVPLTGPLANVGKEIQAATLAAIKHHNANSKPLIELVTQDDGNDPARSSAAVEAMPSRVSALVSCFGTVGCMAQMNAAQPLALPLIGPIAGAAALRGKQAPYVFAVRASAKEELARLLQYGQTNNLKQWAVAVQDDGFGQAYWLELKALLALPAYADMQVSSLAIFSPQKPEYPSVAAQLDKSSTKTLLLLANSSHSVSILQAWRAKNTLPFVMNLSGQANSSFAAGLKDYTGIAAFVTVIPSPWERRLNLQRDYQAAMQAAQIERLSYLGFEAYLNARVAIEAIKNSNNSSKLAMKSILEKHHFAIGGIAIDFGDKAVGRYTDTAVLLADGTFKH